MGIVGLKVTVLGSSTWMVCVTWMLRLDARSIRLASGVRMLQHQGAMKGKIARRVRSSLFLDLSSQLKGYLAGLNLLPMLYFSHSLPSLSVAIFLTSGLGSLPRKRCLYLESTDMKL